VSTLPARDAYALWAPTYAAETAVSALERSAVTSLGVILEGRRLLDVGCGVGRRLEEALAAGAKVAVGVDLVPRMLAEGARTGMLAAADARALPVPDASFDVVWCRLVLGHLAELEAAYAELARVCTAGGRVIVTDFHPAAVAAGHRRTFPDQRGDVHEIEHHVHSRLAHRLAAERAGLSVLALRDVVVDESVRPFYVGAGRAEAYERQRGLPLVLALALAREG
jgi:malonyl-CoA O-methyltransferase